MNGSQRPAAQPKADTQPSPAARESLSSAVARTVHRTTITALLDGASELVIEHAGREYRLRLTQNGKLILTA